MWDQGEKNRRNNSAALGQGPDSPSMDTGNNIFELFCSYWNPLQWGELTVNDGMLPTSTETPEQLEPEG